VKFKKNIFLEVSNHKISSVEFSKNIMKRINSISYGNTYQMDALDINNFRIDMKNKNLYVLIEGETVYIKMVTLPIVKKYLINDMIKNELRYYYKDINHISFTYKLIKEDKSNMEILVFCLKGNNLSVLENSISNNFNLKKVDLIQFCFKNYYSSKIEFKNYIMVFYYNCNLYLLICCNNEIMANNIIEGKELGQLKFSCLMDEFLEQYNDYAKLCEKIYYANIEKSSSKELNIDKYEYLDLTHQILDELKREELIKYIVVKG